MESWPRPCYSGVPVLDQLSEPPHHTRTQHRKETFVCGPGALSSGQPSGPPRTPECYDDTALCQVLTGQKHTRGGRALAPSSSVYS